MNQSIGTTRIVLMAGVVLALGSACAAQQILSDPVERAFNKEEVAELVAAVDTGGRLAAHRDLRILHSEIVKALVAIAERADEGSGEPDDPRGVAIGLLATFSPRDAMKVCIRNVRYHQPLPGESGDGDLAEYPCAMALVQVGRSAAPAILHYLITARQDHSPDEAIHLYARIILAIAESGDPTVGLEPAVALVRRYAARTDEKYNSNFKRLLRAMQDAAE